VTSELVDAVREIRIGLREVKDEARAQTRAIVPRAYRSRT
jgi:hypothetical protein